MLLPKPEKPDHYYVLGVSSKATQTVIKKAWRSLSLALHPDKNPHKKKEATATQKKLNEAYDTVGKDAQRRRDYDFHYKCFDLAGQWAAYRKQQERLEKKRRKLEEHLASESSKLQEQEADKARRAAQAKARAQAKQEYREKQREKERREEEERDPEAAKRREEKEKERAFHEAARLFFDNQKMCLEGLLRSANRYQYFPAETIVKPADMTLEQQAYWIDRINLYVNGCASVSRFLSANPGTKTGSLFARAREFFMENKFLWDWLTRVEELMDFLEELVIEPELRYGVASLEKCMQSILKEDVYFPCAVKERAALLLKKWDAVEWQGHAVV